MRGLIAGALCLLATSPVDAGVLVQPGVPFSAAQLAEAITLRGGADPDRLSITVSSLGRERLALVTPDGRWEIEIGEADGGTAARVVALYVIELEVGVGATGAPDRLVATRAAEVGRPAVGAADRYRLAVLGIGSRGVDDGDFTLMGTAIEVTRGARWVTGGGIAWQHGLTITPSSTGMLGAGARPISADLIRLRVVAGAALGPLEVVAGGFAGRVLVDAGTGGLSRWSTGLVAEARAVLPVSAAWAVELAADAEVFRDRIEVRSGGAAIGATPRGSLGGRIGLAWTGGGAR